MSRKPKQLSSSDILAELQSLLEDFSEVLDRPDIRERVQALVPSVDKLRALGVSLMPEHVNAGARDRILAYFRKYPRTVIDGDELMVVSGIGEWARRVRELRVEFGWRINSGTTYKEMAADLAKDGETEALASLATDLDFDPLEMRPDQYVLTSDAHDRDAAYRWRVLNSIRKSKESVRDKILSYLKHNVGKPVLGEELRYLSPSSEWARRVRELRTEYGWAVASRMTGRPDLDVGVYVLEHERQARLNDRKIPDPVRVNVLRRDNYRCCVCDWSYSDRQPHDPRQFLELHHLEHHAKGGANVEKNLITLCNVHHDEVHRDKAATERVEEMASKF
ncbi:HNH endonuclease [Endobacterium cereale]|uniref:HNH endonuclease n=1 Tax=Endobacterium cereale TaxID=2663029 RepID=UPI002B49333A|nr:HNH endonuclease signature motif containing protein [Endobacterium cereale]MEB2846805.1 HNH endonuclease signature motif containing protein [Endobacterium cereale]